MPSALILQTKIADFGVSTSIGTLSFANTVVGTPSYMAPEVLCGEAEAGGAAADMSSYREPADVWSLGVVLFEALVLSRPFEVQCACDVLASLAQPLEMRVHMMRLLYLP